MNHYVPDFEMEDDHNFNSNSSTTRHKVDDEIMELLWQDGQLVAQPQNQRKQPTNLTPSPSQPPSPSQHHLYMAEDEMATWLHYPLEDLYSELLCENNQTSPLPPISTVRQPPPPPPPTTTASNFGMFSRMRGSNNDLERSSESLRPGLTVVESNSTPAALATLRSVGEVSSAFPGGGGGRRLEKGGGSEELILLSSSGASGSGGGGGGGGSEDVGVKGEVEDRKKKRKEVEESTTQTATTGQDLEHEADNDEKKHSRGHFTAKRSRAAEVHNLSERRRRDRINERMKALQELIPRCNKSDKASMLDEAIEYLKSLQMQVQMMSMGNMVPMMYPGMQQYLPPMGMGMGMGMGMARPMIPFPPMPGSNSPTAPRAAAGPQFGPRFAMPPGCMPSVSSSNLSGNQGGNQVVNSIRGSYPVQSSAGLTQVPNMGDPYQQYLYLQQMQMQIQMQMQQMQAVQNQSISQPGSNKPSTSKSEAQIGPNTSKNEGEEDH